jgi:hypothetical protein
MEMYEVSPLVGKASVDQKELIRPVNQQFNF